MSVMKKFGVFGNLKPIIIPGLAIVSFSYFMELWKEKVLMPNFYKVYQVKNI